MVTFCYCLFSPAISATTAVLCGSCRCVKHRSIRLEGAWQGSPHPALLCAWATPDVEFTSSHRAVPKVGIFPWHGGNALGEAAGTHRAHRAAPLRGGEVHVGDEQHRLRLQVALGPQEGDLIPSEAREQTAFQTYRWRVQFSSAPCQRGAPSQSSQQKCWGQDRTCSTSRAAQGSPEGSQRLLGALKGLWGTGKELPRVLRVASLGTARSMEENRQGFQQGAGTHTNTHRCCWSPGIFLSFGTVSFHHPSFSSLLPVGRSSNI